MAHDSLHWPWRGSVWSLGAQRLRPCTVTSCQPHAATRCQAQLLATSSLWSCVPAQCWRLPAPPTDPGTATACIVSAGQTLMDLPHRCYCTQRARTPVRGQAKCAGALVMSIRALLETISQPWPPYPRVLPMLWPLPVGCGQDQHGGQCWTLGALCGSGREGPHAAPGSAGTQVQLRCMSLSVAAVLRRSAGSAR